MSRQRSLRVTVAVAILAAVLMIFMPLANLFAGNTPGNGPEMSAMSDCGMCPKSDMVMVNCAQAMCGLPAMEASGPAPLAIAPVRYSAVFMSIPDGRHTIPPVSPG
ncbi:hypothetical protein [Taklimakanibacter albus]|uniref:Uncharacterized protein n=1 Tax=Taklimakanibacter albus TaxID=2800327 RepID=A0ACC5R0V0_9HYPH|nr:hypothetical protein [Aestuariivirga sp. YIM B02566]MBK1866285.1 hypothetical protein [Aestuariivirga sp. YIM B02566]